MKKTEKIQKITTNNVKILNPHDSQGVQIADGLGIYPCLRGCGGGGYQQGYVLQHLSDESDPCYAFDVYNMSVSNKVFKTLNSIATDSDHIPVLLAKNNVVDAVFCDIYNFQITGDISCNLNASSCNSPTHSGPSILIINEDSNGTCDSE